MTAFVIGLGCALFTGLVLFAEATENRALKWVAKPAASALFVLLALHCGALATLFGKAVLAGLVCCAIGDVLLITRRKIMFLAGMGAFALGHLAYIAAFMSTGPVWSAHAALSGAVIMLSAAAVLRWLWPRLGEFRLPVTAYTLIIAVMAAASMAIGALPAGAGPPWRLAAGAIIFAISDVAVARDQFVEYRLVNKLWGLPLYYGAQLLFASSL